MSDKDPFESWAVLELFGHRRLAGFVREVELAGSGMWRIDIPQRDASTAVTQFYSPSAVYGLTPVTEEVARAMAERIAPEPVTPLELALPAAQREHGFVKVEDQEVCGLCGKPDSAWVHKGEEFPEDLDPDYDEPV